MLDKLDPAPIDRKTAANTTKHYNSHKNAINAKKMAKTLTNARKNTTDKTIAPLALVSKRYLFLHIKLI